MSTEAKSKPAVEAFANGARVWVIVSGETELAGQLMTPEAVDELIAALETAKRQAWPEVNKDAS